VLARYGGDGAFCLEFVSYLGEDVGIYSLVIGSGVGDLLLEGALVGDGQRAEYPRIRVRAISSRWVRVSLATAAG
jgi:hypothetical protein